MPFSERFLKDTGALYPIIGGAMYPCSNPELVAAVSEAGGIGIIQPLSLTYVHGYDFKKGLEKIKSLTSRPVGINIIVEQSSSLYENRMRKYLDMAIEEGIRFAITALGNPSWVVKKMEEVNGVVYHDATARVWAQKAIDKGVKGIICVNNRAGGHAGKLSPQEIFDQLKDLGLPLVQAGGIGDENEFVEALRIGYDAVQMGTRFIASLECREKDDYKKAIVDAREKDIVLTERVTGIPLSVINTDYVKSIGTSAPPLARFLLKQPWSKQWMRLYYGMSAVKQFKDITLKGASTKDYWQAGKSVENIDKIESVQEIVERFVNSAGAL